MKNVYDYLISRYGHKDYQPNLYMLIEELSNKVRVLEDKYDAVLQDIKLLEEENIESTNLIYEILNSLEAIDNRIDIVGENQQNQL